MLPVSPMQRAIPRSYQLLAEAVAAHRSGDIARAEALYKLVLREDKRQFDALHMLGVIEAQRGNFSAGIARIEEALRVQPNSVDALINLGRMQSELGNNAEAAEVYRTVLTIDPKSILAHNNLSIVFRRQRRYDEAIACCEAALKISPNYADAWCNRGNALFDLGRFDEALADYDRAIALQAGIVEPHLGRGNALRELKRPEEALAAYDRALGIDGNLAKAWFGRGTALVDMRCYEEATVACEKAFRLMPDLEYVEGTRLHSKLQICDWTNLDRDLTHLMKGVRRRKSVCMPFMLLSTTATASDQLKCAETYVKGQLSFPPVWRGEIYKHKRIRVAYVSSDYREHAVARLAAGLFENHDSSCFETVGISLGPARDTAIYRRISTAFHQFIECHSQSDQEVADLMRYLEIDIAVDLNGYTQGYRRGIFARRPAPIQVNYLGYAGTMGADYYDYIIADRTVIPQEHFEFYKESVVWLPDCFMVTDDTQAVAKHTAPRSELQLPEKGFVFCCFNQSQKISPTIFDVWMRLLQQVDGSVLWLRQYNDVTSSNLRREAERRGVPPERLIFAAPVARTEDHLARCRQIGLFLDTLNYNAHATASDALWVGVPVVTCMGSTFAGRVAASLLRAAGFSDLVVENLADYEALALKLATDSSVYASFKDRFAGEHGACALFDTRRFTRNIEAAYATMWRRIQSGEPAHSFSVTAN